MSTEWNGVWKNARHEIYNYRVNMACIQKFDRGAIQFVVNKILDGNVPFDMAEYNSNWSLKQLNRAKFMIDVDSTANIGQEFLGALTDALSPHQIRLHKIEQILERETIIYLERKYDEEYCAEFVINMKWTTSLMCEFVSMAVFKDGKKILRKTSA